ncbi:MAG: CBS domain-containing protein [Myxococcales bacterium]|jgi:CBS domain-containing protein
MKTTIRQITEGDTNCTVDSTLSIRATLELMRARDLSAVAVVHEGRVVGVFSGRDIIRRSVADQTDLSGVDVSTVMSTPVFWIAAEERPEVAKAIMVDHDVRQLVVLDKEEHFCGFVTARELLEADLADARDLIGKLNDSYYAPRYDPRQAR